MQSPGVDDDYFTSINHFLRQFQSVTISGLNRLTYLYQI